MQVQYNLIFKLGCATDGFARETLFLELTHKIRHAKGLLLLTA